MRLELGEVVVGVDPGDLRPEPDEQQDLAQGPVHHPVPVGPGVVLRPEQVGDVGVEFGRALGEPGQVGILERRAVQLGQPAGRGEVRLGQLVADPTGTRMEHDPHPVDLVETDLDEMVP